MMVPTQNGPTREVGSTCQRPVNSGVIGGVGAATAKLITDHA